MRIGENLFSGNGLRLNFQAIIREREDGVQEGTAMVRGILRFGAFARPGYHMMGFCVSSRNGMQAYGFAELWDSFFWEDGSIVLPLTWVLW